MSRATSAIGRDVSITIFTASSLNSCVNFLRRSGILHPPFRAGLYWIRCPESPRHARRIRLSRRDNQGRLPTVALEPATARCSVPFGAVAGRGASFADGPVIRLGRCQPRYIPMITSHHVLSGLHLGGERPVGLGACEGVDSPCRPPVYNTT